MSIQTAPAGPSGAAPGGARSFRVDPVSRVSGALAVQANVDWSGRSVRDAILSAGTFRGYENILAGRDARDAVFVSSRACGVCGGAHAICAAQALEMACGIAPPPLAIASRNVLAALECMYDHPSHLFLRAGPDYSEEVVRRTSPELWARAESTPAPNAALHRHPRIADLMSALTRYEGAFYREALRMARVAREGYVLLGGKYPHPQTITPGGLSATVDIQDINVTLLRIVRFFDYGRRVAAVWDDLAGFLYEADPRYAEVGAGALNMLDLGLWDDPLGCDGSFEHATTWGEGRWATPGVVIGGQLRTTDLHQIDLGIEEHVERSFYADWHEPLYSADALGNPLSLRHPLNKQTLPEPGATDPDGRYSWSTAARWNGEPVETGAHVRMWITARAGRQPHTSFVEATGSALRLSVPQGELPATVVEWRAPDAWNALERNRARAYAVLHAALVGYENVVIALDLARRMGRAARVFTPYRIPGDNLVGVGWWGGGRGAISHHLQLDGRVIANHQIVGPSTFSGSPRDGRGTPGPCEAALMATPLVSPDADGLGIDVLRTIRSFDLCMYCATQ